MVRHAIEGDSLEEIADELERMGVIQRVDDEWLEVVEVLQRVYEATETATEETGGRGRQQGVISRYADLDGEYTTGDVGKLLDALEALGLVDHDQRLYSTD